MSSLYVYGLALLAVMIVMSRLWPWDRCSQRQSLSEFNGPILWRLSRLPHVFSMLKGTLPFDIKKLHDLYGPIVRIALNELSFIASSAWKEIYSRKDFVRPDQMRVRFPGKIVDSMTSANESDHTRFRRIFNPAFSPTNVMRYEQVVQCYVDKLIDALHEVSQTDSPSTNLVNWFNFAAFDIICELGWGTSFQCLEKAEYHQYLTVIGQFKANLFDSAARYYTLVHRVLTLATPTSAHQALALVTSTAETCVRKRLQRDDDRHDVMSYAIKAREKSMDVISIEELEVNSSILMIAGSEPLTTALAGTMNCLLQNPSKLATLVDEIRSSFKHAEDITASSTKMLPYLSAVLNEGLRMCPPVPDNMRRVVPPRGATIAGHFIPSGTVVSIPCWATFQSAENFSHPDMFWPERWLSKDPPKGDNRGAFQPFSWGPSNCLGQNLGNLASLFNIRNIFPLIIKTSMGRDAPYPLQNAVELRR
ncbi:cytochrome P450 ClCP1 [Xylaria cf. heliscus]|nr:cytochrome P450 ClCP1 [Xylaria cf. heliscus]